MDVLWGYSARKFCLSRLNYGVPFLRLGTLASSELDNVSFFIDFWGFIFDDEENNSWWPNVCWARIADAQPSIRGLGILAQPLAWRIAWQLWVSVQSR